jgi:hypothetical protein
MNLDLLSKDNTYSEDTFSPSEFGQSLIQSTPGRLLPPKYSSAAPPPFIVVLLQF